MQINITTLKSHVDTFVKDMAMEAEGAFHKALRGFAEYVEGKKAVSDAVALLEGKGYTVTPPAS